MASSPRIAVIPVGGLGTRFLPATKAVPKEMLPVVDAPLIAYAVEEARAAGVETILLVTARGKGAIEDHFDRAAALETTLAERGDRVALDRVGAAMPAPGRLLVTRQQAPLGLGHAVWCARAVVGAEPFAVILPDDLILSETPCLRQMVEVHREVGGNMVAVMEVPRDRTGRYGIIETGTDDGRLAEIVGMVEKPRPEDAPSNLAIIGRYILMPGIFDRLAAGRRGAGGEIQLTDAMAETIGVTPFRGFRFSGRRYDCGDRLGFLEANIAYALARKELADDVRAMLRGFLDRDGPSCV